MSQCQRDMMSHHKGLIDLGSEFLVSQLLKFQMEKSVLETKATKLDRLIDGKWYKDHKDMQEDHFKPTDAAIFANKEESQRSWSTASSRRLSATKLGMP